MDYKDIFKKLTRGCKFTVKKEKTGIKKENDVSINKGIKVECTSIENINVKQERQVENSSDYDNEDNGITLLGSMQASENGKRAKKRKGGGSLIDSEKKRRLLEQEAINRYRNQNNISVVGRHVPEPAKTFDEFNVDADIIENLKKCGYTEPTTIQKQAVPIMLQGRQLLACAPTGSGKTAAFLVPIIQHLKKPQKDGFRCLIVCPTRELAKQTQMECDRLCENRELRVHIIKKIKKVLDQDNKKFSNNFDILVTTPNRICFLLKQEPPAISLNNVEWVIVDEADKLFEAGINSFREQLEQILQACNNGKRKIAMFSATHTPAVAKWCVHNMKGLIRVTVGHRNAATDLVDQELVFVGYEKNNGKLQALRNLVRKGVMPPVLIFVQSKERAEQLFRELLFENFKVDAIHSDKTQEQRDEIVKDFRIGKIWFLICTELMARGMDFKGINLVINYDFPQTAISYVHRVGRAGRAGRRGKAITFFTIEDAKNLRSIAHVLKQSGCEVPDYMLTLKKPSKNERKKLESSAPPRKPISTRPVFKRKKKWLKKGERNENNRVKTEQNDSSGSECTVKEQFKKKQKKKQQPCETVIESD